VILPSTAPFWRMATVCSRSASDARTLPGGCGTSKLTIEV
jgi:hypothetical protein